MIESDPSKIQMSQVEQKAKCFKTIYKNYINIDIFNYYFSLILFVLE